MVTAGNGFEFKMRPLIDPTSAMHFANSFLELLNARSTRCRVNIMKKLNKVGPPFFRSHMLLTFSPSNTVVQPFPKAKEAATGFLFCSRWAMFSFNRREVTNVGSVDPSTHS